MVTKKATRPQKKRAPAAAPAAVEKPERTPRQQAAVDDFVALEKSRRQFVPITITTLPDGSNQITSATAQIDEATAQGMQCLGVGLTNGPEYTALLHDVINLATNSEGGVDQGLANRFLARVHGIGPTNSVEALLAVQMVAIHEQVATMARRMQKTQNLEVAAYAAKTLNNLSRTFGHHAETLQKLRTTPGQQRVVVEHHHYHLAPGAIAPGSNAVLGDVNGGGVQSAIEGQCHERENGLLPPERAAMLGYLETDGVPVPSSRALGKERLPVSRRASRSTKGKR